MDPASINGTTLELRDAANNLVPATVSYDVATLTARLAPSTPLASYGSLHGDGQGRHGRPACQRHSRQRPGRLPDLVLHHRRAAGVQLPVQHLDRHGHASYPLGERCERL